jgi:DNA-binding MarR family transcriptional regulator
MSSANATRDQRPHGDPGSKDFRVDRYPFYLLNRALGRYNNVILARLRPVGLDIPTWRILMVLGERSPRSMGDIADASVIKLSTAMRILQRMADAGLVTSASASHDGRVTEIDLSALGSVKLAEARRATAPIYAAAIKGMSAAEFARMITSLQQLHDNLSAIELP